MKKVLELPISLMVLGLFLFSAGTVAAATYPFFGDASYNADADFNGNGVINTLDLNIYKGLHRKPPGPSCCAPYF